MGKITYFVKKKIGKETHQFSVEGDNLFDVVMTSKNLSFYDVDKCGLCGSDDLMLSAHIGKDAKTQKDAFEYTVVKCKKCKGSVNFGQQKAAPEIYYLTTREDKDGKKVLDWKPAPVSVEK